MVPEQSSLGRRVGVGRTAEILEWNKDHVIKLFLKEFSRESVEREAKVGRVVHELGLPVAAVIDVVEVNGRYGIVFERADGGGTMLQEFGSKPWRLDSLIRAFTELHLEMHQHSVPELPSLRESLADRIGRITDVPDDLREFAERAKTAALAALDQHPEDDKLCHGDFHPDNIIMSNRGPIIIDWSDAARGSPAADVARTRLLISMGTPVEGRISGRLVEMARKRALSVYLKSYFKRSAVTPESVDAWQLPVVVARITEDVPGERDQLMTLVSEEFGKPTSNATTLG